MAAEHDNDAGASGRDLAEGFQHAYADAVLAGEPDAA